MLMLTSSGGVALASRSVNNVHSCRTSLWYRQILVMILFKHPDQIRTKSIIFNDTKIKWTTFYSVASIWANLSSLNSLEFKTIRQIWPSFWISKMGEAELHNPGLVRFSDEHMEPTTEANNNLDSATANNDNNSKSADTNNVNNQNTNHQTCNNSNSSPEGGQSIELEEALGYLASKKTWHFLIFLAIASFDIPFAFNLMIPVFLVAPNEGPQSPCFYCLGDETVQIDPYTNTNTSLLTQSQQRYTVTSDQCYFAPGEGVDESWQNVTWRQCTKFEGRCDKPYGWTPVKEVSCKESQSQKV